MGNKPTKRSDETIKLLMVGKTGVGKSATANSIFGRKEFESNRSTSAVTKVCQCAFGERQGQKLKVVDMPGLFDGNLSHEEDVETVMDKATDAIVENPDGYNAIVMVTALGRFTQEDKKTINILKAIFGEKFIKQYGILVITHGDLYDPDEYDGKSFEEWCSTETGEFKNIIEECGKRVVLFHNKTEDKNIRAQQLEKLFTGVDELNTMERYTPKLFEAAQADRDRLLIQQKVQGITEKTESKIHKLFDELQLLLSSETANDVNKLRKLKTKADSLLRELEIKDKGTQALTSAIMKVKNLKDALEVEDAADQKKKLAELSESYRQEKKAILKRRLKIAAIAIGITVAVGAVIVGVVFAAPAIAAALGTATAVATGAEAAAATAVGATMAGTATAVTGTATAATAVAGTATAATAVAGTATAVTAVAGTATAVAGTATAVAGTAAAATAVAGTATAATAAVAATATAATAVAETAVAATAGSLSGLALLTVGAVSVKNIRKKLFKKFV